MNIKQKITSAAAIGAMMASVVAPSAFASTTVDIVDNGAFSFNFAKIKNLHRKRVSQANTTVVSVGVQQRASTGKNSSSFNKGGGNTITTGNARNDVVVAVEGGVNENTGDDCGCLEPETNITIEDNGAFSHNTAIVKNKSFNSVSQSNTTVVNTYVGQNSSTGGNSSSFNTSGENLIDTGNASNTVSVVVAGNTNTNN